MQTMQAPATTHQAHVVVVRNPSRIAAEVEAMETQAAKAESPLSHEALGAARRTDQLYEELIRAVMTEHPALGDRARYKARIAASAHEAYLEGSIPLELRNRHATAAADVRAEVLALAQEHLDAAGAGYMCNSGVKELHHVA